MITHVHGRAVFLCMRGLKADTALRFGDVDPHASRISLEAGQQPYGIQ